MKIRPVGTELFSEDGRADRHDAADGRFSLLLRKRLKEETWTPLVKMLKRTCGVEYATLWAV